MRPYWTQLCGDMRGFSPVFGGLDRYIAHLSRPAIVLEDSIDVFSTVLMSCFQIIQLLVKVGDIRF